MREDPQTDDRNQPISNADFAFELIPDIKRAVSYRIGLLLASSLYIVLLAYFCFYSVSIKVPFPLYVLLFFLFLLFDVSLIPKTTPQKISMNKQGLVIIRAGRIYQMDYSEIQVWRHHRSNMMILSQKNNFSIENIPGLYRQSELSRLVSLLQAFCPPNHFTRWRYIFYFRGIYLGNRRVLMTFLLHILMFIFLIAFILKIPSYFYGR